MNKKDFHFENSKVPRKDMEIVSCLKEGMGGNYIIHSLN